MSRNAEIQSSVQFQFDNNKLFWEAKGKQSVFEKNVIFTNPLEREAQELARTKYDSIHFDIQLFLNSVSAANKEKRLSGKFSRSAIDSNRDSTSPPKRDVSQHVRSKSDNPPSSGSAFGLEEVEEEEAVPLRVSRSITAPRLANRINTTTGAESRSHCLPNPNARERPSDKHVQHMEDAWAEFMHEVKSHLRQNMESERNETELREKIQAKSWEIDQLKKRIEEVTTLLNGEDQRVLKFENENCELSMKILDYQLLALKK
jgi:hypothetical protein